MAKHIVGPGDSIPSLAHDHGHFWETLWNHPENAELKARRKNPNILAPGDEVFIPELRVKEFSKPADQSHKFERRGVPAKIKIQMFLLGEPRSNEPYVLRLGDKTYEGSTDGDGFIEAFIPPNCKGGTLTMLSNGDEYPVELGHLNPVDTISGVKQRLNNLGYFCGSSNDAMDEKARQAISQFQADHDLPASGEADGATRGKLQSLHP